MFRADWDYIIDKFPVMGIYMILLAFFSLTSAIYFYNGLFPPIFMAVMSLRLVDVATDAALTEEQRDRRAARMPTPARHVWDLKYFWIYALALSALATLALPAFDIDENVAVGVAMALAWLWLLYCLITKGLRFN